MLKLVSYFAPLTSYPYTGESKGCPVCASISGTQVSSLDRRFKRLPTFACDACGLLYTNPMPTDVELDKYYSEFYRFDYQGALNEPAERHLRKRANESARRAKQIAPLLQPVSKTLDIGCGSGEFVTRMLALGHDAYGVEPNHTYGSYAQSIHGDRVSVQSWQEFDVDQRFDLVTCFHVLEHLRDPVSALRQFSQWTAPNGLVYIEVPNMGNTTRNKGLGGFHFAHVVGFNHHSLLYAASLVNLRPKCILSDTFIVFEHGSDVDSSKHARDGRELTQSLYSEGRATRSYVQYQIGKVLRGWSADRSRTRV